jgi:FAD dependent oxidoreductase TIGR03364
VRQVESGRIYLDDRELKGERIVVCPGADLRSLFAKTFSRFNTRLCQLQMLRIRPPDGYVLGAAVMSDLSLVRYPGFRNTPGAGRLEDRLRQELPRSFQYGVHLIVVQNTDGSLVVGDSHQYGDSISPFESTEAEELILAEMQRVLCLGHYAVLERWTGIYPSGSQDAFIEAVLPGVQLLSVTSGTGMSTAFALAEECLMGERISI